MIIKALLNCGPSPTLEVFFVALFLLSRLMYLNSLLRKKNTEAFSILFFSSIKVCSCLPYY